MKEVHDIVGDMLKGKTTPEEAANEFRQVASGIAEDVGMASSREDARHFMGFPVAEVEHPVHARICEWLASLDLSGFEQTTHCRLGPGTIEDVALALVDAWREPTAYRISNLSQAVRDFQKEQAK